MAREIKVVKNNIGELNVRNVGDQIARGEQTVAAVWQDDGKIKTFFHDEGAGAYAWRQSGRDESAWPLPAAAEEFFSFEKRNYDFSGT
jgi:hypothetical protein